MSGFRGKGGPQRGQFKSGGFGKKSSTSSSTTSNSSNTSEGVKTTNHDMCFAANCRRLYDSRKTLRQHYVDMFSVNDILHIRALAEQVRHTRRLTQIEHSGFHHSIKSQNAHISFFPPLSCACTWRWLVCMCVFPLQFVDVFQFPTSCQVCGLPCSDSGPLLVHLFTHGISTASTKVRQTKEEKQAHGILFNACMDALADMKKHGMEQTVEILVEALKPAEEDEEDAHNPFGDDDEDEEFDEEGFGGDEGESLAMWQHHDIIFPNDRWNILDPN